MKNAILSTTMMMATLVFAGAGSAMAQSGVHITQAEAVKAATSKVQPEYPAMARQLHLEGAVQVEAHITEEGTVEEVKPVTGNAVLANAAVAALKRWKFTPFTNDGKPTKAVLDMSFSFKL